MLFLYTKQSIVYIYQTICCFIKTIFKVSFPGNRELDGSLGNG